MKRFVVYIHAAISLLLLYFLFKRIEFESLLSLHMSFQFQWVIPAFLAMLIALFVKAYRWQVLLHTQHVELSYRKSINLNLIGTFFNYFLPSLTGGDIVKGWMLGKENKKWWEVYSSLIVDRIVGLVALSTLVLTSFIFFSHRLPTQNTKPIIISAVLIPAALLIIYITKFIWRPVLNKYLSNTKLWKQLQKVIIISKNYIKWRKNMIIALLISLIIQFMDVFMSFFLGKALGINIPIAFFFLFVPLITLAAMMPISFNGLGVRETTYVLLFTPLNVKPELAIALSLSYYFLNLSLGIIGGITYLIHSILSGQSLKLKLEGTNGFLPQSEDLVDAQGTGYPNVK